MTGFETFLWGFGGSAAVEIVTLYQHLTDPSKDVLPKRYKRFVFWVIRILLACVGGGLALGYSVDSPILAANVGASTPLILFSLAQGVRGSGEASPAMNPADPGQ